MGYGFSEPTASRGNVVWYPGWCIQIAINLTGKIKDIVKSVILAGIVQILLTGTLVGVFNFSVEMATLIALIPTLVVFGVLLRSLDVL